jgi:hypothetical protein
MRHHTTVLSGLLLGLAAVTATAQPTTPSTPQKTAAPTDPTHCPPAHAGVSPRSRAPDSSTAVRRPRAPVPHAHRHHAAAHRPANSSMSPCR